MQNHIVIMAGGIFNEKGITHITFFKIILNFGEVNVIENAKLLV